MSYLYVKWNRFSELIRSPTVEPLEQGLSLMGHS